MNFFELLAFVLLYFLGHWISPRWGWLAPAGLVGTVVVLLATTWLRRSLRKVRKNEKR